MESRNSQGQGDQVGAKAGSPGENACRNQVGFECLQGEGLYSLAGQPVQCSATPKTGGRKQILFSPCSLSGIMS